VTTEEKYELFEAYLDKSLQADEKIAFELLMQNSEDKAAFDLYCQIQNTYVQQTKNETSENAFVENLKKTAEQYNAQDGQSINQSENTTRQHKNSNPFIRSHMRSMALAACLALIAGIFLFKDSFISEQTSAQLFACNYSIENLSVERGTSIDSLNSIVSLYNAKQFKEVLPQLNMYAAAHPDNGNLQLAEAICNLELNNNAIAEQKLQSIIAANNIYKEKAQWYLAMCYLKQDKQLQLIALIHTFSKDHFYYKKAKEITLRLK
jgi:hypothetical protein